MTTSDEYICSICGQPGKDYGNNAQPVNNGQCCDFCNAHVVLPARFKAHLGYVPNDQPKAN